MRFRTLGGYSTETRYDLVRGVDGTDGERGVGITGRSKNPEDFGRRPTVFEDRGFSHVSSLMTFDILLPRVLRPLSFFSSKSEDLLDFDDQEWIFFMSGCLGRYTLQVYGFQSEGSFRLTSSFISPVTGGWSVAFMGTTLMVLPLSRQYISTRRKHAAPSTPVSGGARIPQQAPAGYFCLSLHR